MSKLQNMVALIQCQKLKRLVDSLNVNVSAFDTSPTHGGYKLICELNNSIRAQIGYLLNNVLLKITDNDIHHKYKDTIKKLIKCLEIIIQIRFSCCGRMYLINQRFYEEEYFRLDSIISSSKNVDCREWIYVERNYFSAIANLCDDQNDSRLATHQSLCTLTTRLIAKKSEIDVLDTDDVDLSHQYISTWNNYQTRLLEIIVRNYDELFNTVLVKCLHRFLDQQIQLKITFAGVKKRDTGVGVKSVDLVVY